MINLSNVSSIYKRKKSQQPHAGLDWVEEEARVIFPSNL